MGGVKGHNKNEISFARIPLATAPGKPRRACPVLTGWPGSFTIFEGKPFSPMILIINVFGTEFVLKRPITLDLESATLRDVLIALQRHHEGPWKRMLKEDLSLQEGCVVLVNGRNIASLEKLETSIHDGDEITFTVLVAGG